jgi:molybdopterin-synthase adenylyltransferase
MSGTDHATEASYANLAREITGLPLVGMTLSGGDKRWSARVWDDGIGRTVGANPCENVRVIYSNRLRVSWNDEVRPRPSLGSTQLRTATCWGEEVQADLARLRVLVVGVGSVGMPVTVSLAATGIEAMATMDYDTIKNHNLDRLGGATSLDAYLKRSKVSLAGRLMAEAATAVNPEHQTWELSICEADGLRHALDFVPSVPCRNGKRWQLGRSHVHLAASRRGPVEGSAERVDALDQLCRRIARPVHLTGCRTRGTG